MTLPRVTADEAKAFLAANPTVQWIDIILFDLNGMPRGKRIRPADLQSVVKSGLMLPASVYVLDPRGNSIAETGRLWETGDYDVKFHLVAGTLHPAGGRGVRLCAQLRHHLRDGTGRAAMVSPADRTGNNLNGLRSASGVSIITFLKPASQGWTHAATLPVINNEHT